MSVIINIHVRINICAKEFRSNNFHRVENEIFLFKSLSLWIKGIRAGIITISLPLPYHNF